MPDHGADVVNVAANLSADFLKGMAKISAEGIKMLLLLSREGTKVRSGQTNIKKLIKSLDAGDQITDAHISKMDAQRVAELSNKHKVLYAIVEDAKGDYTVYFQQSQADRMKNILQDIKAEHLKEEKSVEMDEANHATKESIPSEELINEEPFKVKGDETEVIFDLVNPNRYIEIAQQYDPQDESKCGSTLFLHEEGKSQRVTAEQADRIVNTFEDVQSFKAKGFYKEEHLQKQINRIISEHQQEVTKEQMKQEKGALVDKIFAEEAQLDGNLHLITDKNQPQNVIAVYKKLENENGQYRTVNKVVALLEDKVKLGLESSDVKALLESFESYKYEEKKGGAAQKQYDQIISGAWNQEKKKKMLGEIQEEITSMAIGTKDEEFERKPLSEIQEAVDQMKKKAKEKESGKDDVKTVKRGGNVKMITEKEAR